MQHDISKKSKFELVKEYFAINGENQPAEKKQLEDILRIKLKISPARDFNSPYVQARLRQILKGGPPAKKFLDIFAWIAIGYGGLSIFSVIFNIFFFYVFPFERILEQYQQAFPEQQNIFKFFDIMPYLLIYSFVYYSILLVVGIGMLKRMSWAHIGIKVMLIFAIISTIVMPFVLDFETIMFMPAYNQEMVEIMNFMRIFYYVFLVFFVLLFLALYGWLYYRINKPDIEEEFNNPYRADEHLYRMK